MVSRDLLFLYVTTMAALEEEPTTTELTEVDINALLPTSGKETTAVLKFNIKWVRSALAALKIAVDDTKDTGECKAALATYYTQLNAAKSDINTAASVGGPWPPHPPAALPASIQA